MKRFLRWLFPALFSPYATCSACGRTRLKSEMYRMYVFDGLFCTQEEADRYWLDNQI